MMNITPREITQISDTRRARRYENSAMVKRHFGVIIQVLQNKIEADSDENSVEAEGILNNLLNKMLFCHKFVFILTDTFRIINILSKALQNNNAS